MNIALGAIVFTSEQNKGTVEILFYQSRIHHLGNVISNEGIDVDPTKVEDIREWPASTNVPEVCKFVVLAGYYRRFVEGF
jgi:hypothetical protein